MNAMSRSLFTSFTLLAVIALTGCQTAPKRPSDAPPPTGSLLEAIDVVERPELEPEWADFVKEHYPNWRKHYWVDRGHWGNRGYLVGQTPRVTPPVQDAQIQPLPPAPAEPAPLPPVAVEPPTIVPVEPPPVVVPAKPARPTSYTVQKGDSLWKIAGKVYGNPLKWPRIYKANEAKIKHANKIFPGQVLVIPQD